LRVNDGESDWVEGLRLLSVYLILALAFYFVPAPR
jgi:Ca2+/H+ antiporter